MATINAINNSASSDFTITSGKANIGTNLTLPTTSSTVGQIKINNIASFHAYGTRNIFSGPNAGNFSLTGSNLVVYGSYAGNSITSASNCVIVGNNAARLLSEGNYNCLIGHSVAYSDSTHGLTTGSYNTVIGSSSATSWTGSESSNIYIGYGIAGASESNVLRIGNGTGTGAGNINVATICGISGKTSTSGAAVYCNSSNILGTTTSNRDSKQDIADMGDDSSVIYQLRARTFKFKADTDPKPKQFGMIAEEVEEVFPDMVLYDQDGKPWNLAYQFLAPMLVNEIQKLKTQIDELETQITGV